ncbi:tetratricopeptide repeat protein [Chitinophaga skermanii]|uniref:Tetratricopeptide repeat protein n=1 Tax=Chitinophaga skermanii TaxID=331697 RepID=A0A327QKM9_9BACT|nr:tetratricopeptide repeat protein [Chitinophaga skermanii]RAJ05089.1 tetratricopeptide repeat protein [Chitinophaga skermanii]
MKQFITRIFISKQVACCVVATGAALIGSTAAIGQQTRVYTDTDKTFKDAQLLYKEGKYAVSMQLFKQVIDEIGRTQQSSRNLVYTDAQYYYTVCALKLGNPNAETLAEQFVKSSNNAAREQLVSYQLAKYYFQQNRFKDAIPYYEAASIDNLSNDEIADAKFELAYCYFNVKDFNKAQPLFASIKEIQNKYYIPANYYYGFIAYYKKQYAEALKSFQRVEKEPKYATIVPYYIAEIYYFQHKHDQLIAYAQPYLSGSNKVYYDAEMRKLLGQAYFEKKDYPKALPFLQEYNENADAVSKEDVYQLSFSYYQTNNFAKAISGFKQLSSEKDSLGQNSMYLLGDCYLRTNQKANARNAFAFCARNSSNPEQQEISRFNYGKLSYELGYSDAALQELTQFVTTYPNSKYNKEAREVLVGLFMNTNNYKDALTTIEQIKDKNITVQKAHQRVAYGRATQLINDSQLAEADQLLDVAISYNHDAEIKSLAQFWKGEIALRQNNSNKAIPHLRAYLGTSTPPVSGEANAQNASYNLGYSLLKNEQYSEALPYFESAQRASGPNAGRIANDAALRSADCYYMLKDYPKANALYDRIINNNEQGADYATYQKSVIMGIQGKDTEKVNLLKQLNSKYPSSNFNNDATFEIANTYLANEKYNEAIPYLKSILDKQPNGPNAPKALLKLGTAYYNAGNESTALNYYRQAAEKFPNTTEAAEALDNIKEIYVSENKTDEYLAFLRSTGRTLSVNAEDSLAYAGAENKFTNGDYKGAGPAFAAYLQKYPNGNFALPANFYKAESYYNVKDFSSALPGYEFVLSKSASPYTERSALQAASLNYTQTKNYTKAREYYAKLREVSTSKENSLVATRGLLRANYQLQNWNDVSTFAEALLSSSNISTDDQIIGHYYLGKAQQTKAAYDEAIAEYKIVIGMTKSEIGADSRYSIANCYFLKNDLATAEKAAFDVIKNTPSYENWIAKTYILLGDIYAKQKDYFNAKATYQSVAENCPIPEFKNEAKDKLAKVEAEEKANSKIKKP